MKIPGKGAVLSIDISSVSTPVGQIVSAEIAENEPEMFEGRTLDQTGTGMEEQPTGYVTPGDITGELFFDSRLAAHALLLDADPLIHFEREGSITLGDGDPDLSNAGATSLAFTATSIGASLTIAMNDGVKSSFTIKQKEPAVLTAATFGA
ncbi:hypothetical protein [Alienimonas sp. DA493]|uniref:hypothetical protein n=1 Tax=Alienimonas sp. DA493 TaxID=3373605 RepID=UPI0037548B70